MYTFALSEGLLSLIQVVSPHVTGQYHTKHAISDQLVRRQECDMLELQGSRYSINPFFRWRGGGCLEALKDGRAASAVKAAAAGRITGGSQERISSIHCKRIREPAGRSLCTVKGPLVLDFERSLVQGLEQASLYRPRCTSRM